MYDKLFPFMNGQNHECLLCFFCLAGSLIDFWLGRFYIIIEVGVHILIGVFHTLCEEMIDILPDIVELFR